VRTSKQLPHDGDDKSATGHSRKKGKKDKTVYEEGFERKKSRRDYLEAYKDSDSMFLFLERSNNDRKVHLALAHCYVNKDDIVVLNGKWYRWSLVYTNEIISVETCTNVPTLLRDIYQRNAAKESASKLLDVDNLDNAEQVLPQGWKLLLELKGCKRGNKNEFNWVPHASIQKSEIREGGNGLIAEKRFYPGETIGVYAGPFVVDDNGEVFQTNLPFEPKPSDERLSGLNLKTSDYSITVMNSKGLYNIVNPEPGPNKPLFLGMHFINSWNRTFMKKTKIRGVDRTNCVIEIDGGISAIKRIEAGSEILCDYGKGHDKADSSGTSKTESVILEEPANSKADDKDSGKTDDNTGEKKKGGENDPEVAAEDSGKGKNDPAAEEFAI